jgi:hypothetical protein
MHSCPDLEIIKVATDNSKLVFDDCPEFAGRIRGAQLG